MVVANRPVPGCSSQKVICELLATLVGCLFTIPPSSVPFRSPVGSVTWQRFAHGGGCEAHKSLTWKASINKCSASTCFRSVCSCVVAFVLVAFQFTHAWPPQRHTHKHAEKTDRRGTRFGNPQQRSRGRRQAHKISRFTLILPVELLLAVGCS